MKRICVIDGQGGGIGAAVIKAVKDVITGPISIGWANAMFGEVTPGMAEAVMPSPAPKVLLPLAQEPVVVVGVSAEPLPHLVQQIVTQKLREVLPDV